MRIPVPFLLAAALPVTGWTACGGAPVAASENPPPWETGADEAEGGEVEPEPSVCAPVRALRCGEVVTGDTSGWEGGTTSVMDHYPAAVGNFSGPELVYSLDGDGAAVTLEFVDPDPIHLDQDVFVLEDDGGRCDPAFATARGHNGLSLETEAGARYYVVVDGFDGAAGPFALRVDCGGGATGPEAPECLAYTSQEQESAPIQWATEALPESALGLAWQTPTTHTTWVDFAGEEGRPATHEGIDWIHADPAVPTVRVVAAAPGTVAYVRLGCGQSDLFDRNLDGRECGAGWGDHVVIDHGDGVFTRYAHLAPGSVQVRVGDVVEGGALLAAMGNSGRSETRHLHFELGLAEGGFDPCAPTRSFDRVVPPSLIGL